MDLADQPTNIDRRECTRIVPMRCLVLGLGRTGTKSVCTALSMLGFDHVYHMDSALNNPPDNAMWLCALDAKLDHKACPFGREEWDQLLGHCQAVTDFPAVLFSRELIETYPEAKVILTNRNVDSWFESILRTIDWRYHDPGLYITSLISPAARLYASMFYKTWFCFAGGDFKSNGRKVFVEHYNDIRATVPSDRLLEYHVKDGWEPLCNFLGVECPREPFPSGNDTGDFKALVRKLDWLRVHEVMWENIWSFAAVGGVAAIAAWYSRASLLRR